MKYFNFFHGTSTKVCKCHQKFSVIAALHVVANSSIQWTGEIIS